MAKYKRKTSSIDVTGMSIADIMNVDIATFNKFTESDLRRLTSRLVSAGNKRIRALEKKGIKSPAFRSLGTDNRFSTKVDKTLSHTQQRNKLAQEFSRVRNFLTMKTSSVRGAKRYFKDQDLKLAESMGVSLKDIGKVDKKKAFEILHKLQERGDIPYGMKEIKGSKEASEKARNYIFSQMMENPEIDEDTLMKDTTDNYDNEYDETEEIEM